MSRIDYEIEEHIADICDLGGGWTLEINRVKFGIHPAKIDIRAWNETHDKMGKGLRLSDQEFNHLKDKLQDIDI